MVPFLRVEAVFEEAGRDIDEDALATIRGCEDQLGKAPTPAILRCIFLSANLLSSRQSRKYPSMAVSVIDNLPDDPVRREEEESLGRDAATMAYIGEPLLSMSDRELDI